MCTPIQACPTSSKGTPGLCSANHCVMLSATHTLGRLLTGFATVAWRGSPSLPLTVSFTDTPHTVTLHRPSFAPSAVRLAGCGWPACRALAVILALLPVLATWPAGGLRPPGPAGAWCAGHSNVNDYTVLHFSGSRQHQSSDPHMQVIHAGLHSIIVTTSSPHSTAPAPAAVPTLVTPGLHRTQVTGTPYSSH